MSDTTVVAVKLRYNPKTYWFDPVLNSYTTGDHVLVDTERGREIGLVVEGALQVSEAAIKALNCPLKPVIRALNELDYDHIDALDAKGREAMPVFRELIGKHGLEMKPVAVEYLFTGEKAVFYFSNDERVDFRELVRELAARFHVRVDMRQIGVRDEARILGGLAHCGEELCCARLGGEFQPVSIRMAKEQDLPLNPAKISGACGRLMCCLRYEFEAYKDFKGRAPKKGAVIETPLGLAKVVDFDTPREVINMRLEDGKALSIPLADFECDVAEGGGCGKPCRVGREAVDRCASSSIQLALAALERETNPLSEVTERSGSSRGSTGSGGRERGGQRRGAQGGDRETQQRQDTRRPRRGTQGKQAEQAQKGKDQQGERSQPQSQPQAQHSQLRAGEKAAKPRPGQHSSGLRQQPRRRTEKRSSDGQQSGARDTQGFPQQRMPNTRAEQGSSGTQGSRQQGTQQQGDGRRRRRRSGGGAGNNSSAEKG
ncbi:MAG: hypothetical protein LBS98_06410 [Coriobacteriales bacterium]|jgi:cell fate regulator YaaT (PSP1 superfamily)|nr:hypothetical protein [Coriobacteriales bacterium]